jgi:hypothetical protein
MSVASDEQRLAACVALIGATGAQEFQLRYSDDEQPVVWIAVARHRIRGGRPVGGKRGREVWESAAAMDPLNAAFRLCETLVDGGQCQHCSKPTGVTLDFGAVPMRDTVCWYQYDPELEVFRRGCE